MIVDFAWLLFIGVKIGFTEKQTGQMTFRKWILMYKAYKDNFDLEQSLITNQRYYVDIGKESTTDIDDVIPL